MNHADICMTVTFIRLDVDKAYNSGARTTQSLCHKNCLIQFNLLSTASNVCISKTKQILKFVVIISKMNYGCPSQPLAEGSDFVLNNSHIPDVIQRL